MQRITLLVAALMLTLCLTNSYAAEENQSESEDCWVIVKETYEWITDDEEMAAMHYEESNLTYDSECRLIERTDESYDSSNHDFTSYNEDGTISMSRGEVNSATSDFFICIGSHRGLDFGGERNNDGQGFAAFGKVIEGMDIVRDINGMPSNKKTDNEYVKDQMINNPIIIEKAVRF